MNKWIYTKIKSVVLSQCLLSLWICVAECNVFTETVGIFHSRIILENGWIFIWTFCMLFGSRQLPSCLFWISASRQVFQRQFSISGKYRRKKPLKSVKTQNQWVRIRHSGHWLHARLVLRRFWEIKYEKRKRLKVATWQIYFYIYAVFAVHFPRVGIIDRIL